MHPVINLEKREGYNHMRAGRRRGKGTIATLLTALLVLGAAAVSPVLLRNVVFAKEGAAPSVLVLAPVAAPAPERHATPEPAATPESVATSAPAPIETPKSQAPAAYEAALEMEGALEPEPTVDALAAHPGQGMQIQTLYQRDYRDTAVRVGGRSRTVASSGCGAVCVSMVISYLTGNAEQTPESLFLRAVEMGEYFGSGLTHETLSALLDENGVQNEWIPNEAQGIEQALREGKPVIAHMGPGTFTRNGHYVLLRGYAEDGQVLVNDPASPDRSAETYPLEKIVRQARREDSFLVCWPEAEEVTITYIQAAPVVDTDESVPAIAAAADAVRGA